NRAVFTAVTSDDIFGKKIIAIAAGTAHTLALDDNGKIYATGAVVDGALGLGNWWGANDRATFTAVTLGDIFDKHVTAIAAGYSYSLALTSDGKIYATGYNIAGQLGLGDKGGDAYRDVFTEARF
ncbi:MAG: hypothetical protein LBC09_02725, partial [Helicobacteraceae bacterium]|nr:hypothetical protein [Helicobacteraceae bacterium]